MVSSLMFYLRVHTCVCRTQIPQMERLIDVSVIICERNFHICFLGCSQANR